MRLRRDSDYLKPLENEPVSGETVSGETVKVVEEAEAEAGAEAATSKKWPSGIRQEWDYQGELVDEAATSEKPIPWEVYHAQGRQELRVELRLAATHSIRAEKWASVLTDLPDGLLTDIRAVAEKLRQTILELTQLEDNDGD